MNVLNIDKLKHPEKASIQQLLLCVDYSQTLNNSKKLIIERKLQDIVDLILDKCII
jgi:hypothetical protein